MVKSQIQIGIKRAIRFERLRSGVGDQVIRAPIFARFVKRDIVAALLKLRGDAAQKMRVAVIPVGAQRVRE